MRQEEGRKKEGKGKTRWAQEHKIIEITLKKSQGPWSRMCTRLGSFVE